MELHPKSNGWFDFPPFLSFSFVFQHDVTIWVTDEKRRLCIHGNYYEYLSGRILFFMQAFERASERFRFFGIAELIHLIYLTLLTSVVCNFKSKIASLITNYYLRYLLRPFQFLRALWSTRLPTSIHTLNTHLPVIPVIPIISILNLILIIPLTFNPVR